MLERGLHFVVEFHRDDRANLFFHDELEYFERAGTHSAQYRRHYGTFHYAQLDR
jgi:hypothetical protein